MAVNLSQYVGKGRTPKQFVEGMTRNQDKFLDWYDRFSWPNAAEQAFFEGLQGDAQNWRCLILMADWCGDVVRNTPVVFRLMEAAQIPVDVLILEEHLELMDEHFLTLGGRSIPVVLLTDANGYLIGRWGPRPTYVQEPMVQFKQNNPDRSAPDYEANLKDARAEIMRRYGEDTGYQALIVQELHALFTR